MNKILEIKSIPTELKVEPIGSGELYPKLVLQIELTSPLDFIILESKAKIKLEKEKGGSQLEILCKPYVMRLRRTDRYIRFYTLLTPKLYQSIETFRAGENIKVHLEIDRLDLLPYETTGNFTPVQENSATSVLKGNIIPDNLFVVSYFVERDRLLITREVWAEKVLKSFGVNDRFIFEMPCMLPDITSINTENAEVNELKNRIIRGIALIKKAKDEYNSTKDVEKTVDYVRQATDLLHNIPNRDALFEVYGKYLIEKSATGSENISKEQIESIFNIIDSLFDISSKGPHATTRKTKERMEYYPKYEDADVLLGIVAFIYYFLSKKFERWLTIA